MKLTLIESPGLSVLWNQVPLVYGQLCTMCKLQTPTGFCVFVLVCLFICCFVFQKRKLWIQMKPNYWKQEDVRDKGSSLVPLIPRSQHPQSSEFCLHSWDKCKGQSIPFANSTQPLNEEAPVLVLWNHKISPVSQNESSVFITKLIWIYFMKCELD